MASPLGPEQFASLLSADGMHAYVEKYYGHRAGKIAGGVVVTTFLMFCLAVLGFILRAAYRLISAEVSGTTWPTLEFGSATSLAISLLAIAAIAWWSHRTAAGIKATLAKYVTERVEPTLLTFQGRLDDADAHRIEHFAFFSKRLEALEDHTNLPGANPLKEFLVQRYMENAKQNALTIHSASYGFGRQGERRDKHLEE
jgi:hypothetical protein